LEEALGRGSGGASGSGTAAAPQPPSAAGTRGGPVCPPFNSCLLNLYEEGSRHLGWHRDDERLFGSQPEVRAPCVGRLVPGVGAVRGGGGRGGWL